MDGKGTILVVDDDRAVLDSLRYILQRYGYEVEAAGTAEDALIMLAERPFDLVLTDLRMPGMDGLELLGEVKRRSRYTPVIVLTAHASAEIVIRALRGGVSDFVVKPFRPEELLSIVGREVARHKQAVPPGVSAGLGRQFSGRQLDQIDQLMAELRAETSARCVILVENNGHVIDTKGIIEDINVSALAALVAGDFAATAGIASLIGEGESFRLNYHEGLKYSAYSAQVTADVFLLIIFGQEIKSGMVLYYARHVLSDLKKVVEQAGLGRAAPSPEAAPAGTGGLLGGDMLSALDAQFADLWKAD